MDNNISLLIQLLISIGTTLIIVVLGGIIIDYIEKVSNRNLQRGLGKFAVIITGLGTIVHELSHLLFVYLGGMKPTNVKLFRPIEGLKDGILGYVEYSYNKKNWYQRMSLVFVGIAPIFGGITTIIISLKLLLPNIFDSLNSIISGLIESTSKLDVGFLKNQLVVLNRFIIELFTIENLSIIQFWILIFIILSISSHMSLSKADIKSALNGMAILLIVLLILSLIISILGINEILSLIAVVNIYVLIFISIGIAFSLINMLVAIIICKVFK